ncbi:calcitonin gene-related peptide type 1 receptor-like [Uloborus diversus]|uniref:calcitonin gene-related peptide type 1 receptor-like n=1 Tax=Uloborus diversus TaxID=327109 RepID=UPI00240923C5|nr:calcitonin gene-related peptide type 1 receptor-like [Uloborus diversus]
MLPILIIMSLQGLVRSNITTVNEYSISCRTERRMYLLYTQFLMDTCARCYKYMPSVAFKNKFRYSTWLGLLRDPSTNQTFEADHRNVSKAIENSFSEEQYFYNWKECCIAAEECCERMTREPVDQIEGPYCPRTWDGWQCWDDTPAGTTAQQPCQAHIYFQTTPPSCTKYAYKTCWENGTWLLNENNREWTNYSKCGRVDEHRRFLYFHIATYAVSVVSMIPALIIFSVYKQLQVQRITMHKNLFLSLFLNGVVVLLFKSLVVLDEFNRSPTYQTTMQKNGATCRALFVLTKYFRMTNYMWMFCEGFYLHKLIAAAFAEQKNLLMFYIIGWVVPLLPVGIYTVIRKTMFDEKCWALPAEEYEWIMNAPNMLSLLINLFFLCNIIRVLVTKLRATHSNEPSQYRKAVRATLVLVPLFGLHFGLIIYRPQSGKCGFLEAYTYFSHALDGLQGFFVSLIFCYMNGEVLYLTKRTYQRYRLSRHLGSRTQNSIMMNPVSMTQMSTMVESQSSFQRGLHYRTKGGDNKRDGYNSVAEGSTFSTVEDDVAEV